MREESSGLRLIRGRIACLLGRVPMSNDVVAIIVHCTHNSRVVAAGRMVGGYVSESR